MATLTLGESSSAQAGFSFLPSTPQVENMFAGLDLESLLSSAESTGLPELSNPNSLAAIPRVPPQPQEVTAEQAAKVRSGSLVLNSDFTQNIPPAVTTQMQLLLTQTGYLRQDQVSGVYDVHTVAAVRRFQSEIGINEDGIIGLFTANLLFRAAGRNEGMTEAQFREFLADPENTRFVAPGYGKTSISSSEIEELYDRADKVGQRVQAEERGESLVSLNRESYAQLFNEVQTDPSRLTDRYINSSRVSGTIETLQALDNLFVQAGFDGVYIRPNQSSDKGGVYTIDRVASPLEGMLTDSNEWYLENWGWSPLVGQKSSEQRNRESREWLERNAPEYGFATVPNGERVDLVYLGKERALQVAQERRSSPS